MLENVVRFSLAFSEVRIIKYGVLGILLLAFFLILLSLLSKRKNTPLIYLTLFGFSVVTLIGIDAYCIEPNWIETNTVVIRDKDLADVLKDKTVVHITDLHLNEGLRFREYSLIRKVNAIKPDYVFITGDFIDDLTQLQPLLQLLKSIHAKVGIYGVPGNTDHISIDGNTLSEQLKGVNFELLVNASRKIEIDGKYFWLVGADDPVYGFANIKTALRNVDSAGPTILLAHSPDIFMDAVNNQINLVLVGHTHGGQVGIPFLIRLSNYANRTPYIKGLFQKNRTVMYVNKGIGMKTLPIRFLCRPEITIIKFKP